MKRLTYANVMSTLAMFLALGGTAYAVTASPVRIVKRPVFVSAATYDSNGQVERVGIGTSTATCPRGQVVIGGGHSGFLADSGTMFINTSAPTANGTGWLTWAENYAQRAQTVYVTAMCVKRSALQ